MRKMQWESAERCVEGDFPSLPQRDSQLHCSPASNPAILVNLGFEELILVFAPLPNNAIGTVSTVDQAAAALTAAITEQHLRAQTPDLSRWSRTTQLRESAVSQPSFRLSFSR